MKKIACVVAFAIAAPGFAGSVAVAKHAALATASPIATQIGLDVLKRGGNAIDASVAVAFALAVARPDFYAANPSLILERFVEKDPFP